MEKTFVGSLAPDFTLLDEQGVSHALSSYRGTKNVVLIFYPGDDTAGCTVQLCAVRDDIAEFTKRNAIVLGVNHSDAASHHAFIKKFDLKNPLLIDPDRAVARLYDAIGQFFGHETTKRTVVIIDGQGIIRYYHHGLPLNRELLKVLDELQ